MKLSHGIQTLADSGLNIFLSAKVSDLPSGLYPWSETQKQKTLCLIGHGGKKLWENLPHPLKLTDHPIDNFSLKQINWFAENILKDEIEILFPNNDFVLPLQQLGRFFNLCTPSPLGIDINQDYGLWFAFRAVFLTNKTILKIGSSPSLPLCETCTPKFCVTEGRLGCPIGKEHQYSKEQLAYHAAYASQIEL